MEGFRAKPGSDRPSLYTEAGLDAFDERQQRALRGTYVFVWAVNAGMAAFLALVTGDVVVPVVAFALLTVVGTLYVRRFARQEQVAAAFRRRAIPELVARRDELDLDESLVTLDRLHAKQRRVFMIALVGGSLCILSLAPIFALSPMSATTAAIAVGVFLALYLATVLNGIRKLDRDFEQRRADTRELLTRNR
jgi:membrane protein implicated in regulation of membrane protease activity